MSEEKKPYRENSEQRQPAIVFLSISLALFLAFIGFFAWHTVRMRSYELNYIKTTGTVVGVQARHSTSGTYYYPVISYNFDGEEYTFTDRTGYGYSPDDKIGSSTEIYVDPQDPLFVERVSSADFVSIICACLFAFFCVTYSAGMNCLLSLKGSSFKKRLTFAWGAELLLGAMVLLLFWLGLPNSGFGEVFLRIKGAIGVTVISGLVLCVAALDGVITHRLRSKR